VKSDLFEAALLKTQKTWKTYVTALCALNLGFLIDALGGSHFFGAGGEINLAGFKVVREALSAAYGLLFLAFIATTFYESRLLKTLSQPAVHFPESPELALWFLSPFSRSLAGRVFRKCLFVVGYFCLAVFSVIHITKTSAPQTDDIRALLYVPIGYADGLILCFCVYLGVKICQNLRFVRHRLEMIEGRNT